LHLSSSRGGESRKTQASQAQAPGKVMGQFLLQVIFRHMKNKEVTRNRQQISSDQPSCLLQFMSHDWVHGQVDSRLSKWIIAVLIILQSKLETHL